MATIKIERYDPTIENKGESPELLELYAAHARFSSQFEDSAEWDDKSIAAVLDDTLARCEAGTHIMFVAHMYDDGANGGDDVTATDARPETVGYMVISSKSRENGDRAIDIEEMYVVPELRGNGIGRLLVGRARECATQIGATKLLVRCWNDNAGACAFYEALGMQPKVTEFHVDV